MFWIYAIAAGVAIFLLNGSYDRFVKRPAQKLHDDAIRARKEARDKEEHVVSAKREFDAYCSTRLDALDRRDDALQHIIKEKTQSFPWLAGAIADYVCLEDGKLADFLTTKKHPAQKSAERVAEVSREKRILARQLVQARYQIRYYEALFPYLTEFNDEDIDDLLIQVVRDKERTSEEEDPVHLYVTPGEYDNLGITERNQRALDRYLAHGKKSSWQLGRDYERYVGHLYTQKSFTVTYHGIEQGLEDLGRDLVCRKSGRVDIVQCKYWASHKQIHEKHLTQLFGTTVKFYLEQNPGVHGTGKLSLFPDLLREANILPVFYTSTKLSPTAKRFADALGVEVHENEPLQAYPMIKCHTNKITHERIYHLPFDQMYDRTILESRHGEFVASTVAEAEAKGFRRAWRWQGEA